MDRASFPAKGPSLSEGWKRPPETPEAKAKDLRGAATESADVPDDAYPEETKNLAAKRPETVAELKKLPATHPEAKPQIRGKARSDIR